LALLADLLSSAGPQPYRGGLLQAQGAALRRSEKAHTKETIVEATGRALDAIVPEDAKGWFGHCRYPPRVYPT
jgi:hypothetical protein